jgi:hypothetical protein
VPTPPRRLFAGLIDDAAMFPPGNATAEVAIAEHERYRGSWFADLVGPLLVPAAAFQTFVAAHRAAGLPRLDVVLIGTATAPATMPEGATLVGFELPVPDVPLPEIPGVLTLAAELSPGPGAERVLAALTQSGLAGCRRVAKFRTGGTTAEAFPSEDLLAEVICAANAVSVPLKLTAGLHHALRHTDPTTGFEHHGFLNVMVAVARAAAGGQSVVSEALAVRSAATLVSAIGKLTDHEVTDLRRRFLSFGCCGVEDPITDLVELGLVEPKEAHA